MKARVRVKVKSRFQGRLGFGVGLASGLRFWKIYVSNMEHAQILLVKSLGSLEGTELPTNWIAALVPVQAGRMGGKWLVP